MCKGYQSLDKMAMHYELFAPLRRSAPQVPALPGQHRVLHHTCWAFARMIWTSTHRSACYVTGPY